MTKSQSMMSEKMALPIAKSPIEILQENGIWPIDPSSPKGKSMEDPILIQGVHFYVKMEYRVMNILFAGKNNELIIQGLCEKDGRKIDCMLMKVSNQDGSDEHYEKVYFDITEGYNSL